MVLPAVSAQEETCPAIAPRIWIYTNFDCNLHCTYCVAESHPRAERRGLAKHAFERLVDEAVECGIRDAFITGGEPFLLLDIGERIRYASERLNTTVLTNAMLFRGKRLAILESLIGLPIRFQVSLDGADAATHDAYRGEGAWQKTIDGIRLLREFGFTVAIGTTETSANRDRLDDVRAFVCSLGIQSEDHFIRPLARRGFSTEGMEVTAADLEPEVTVSVDGVFWHPLTLDDDLLVSRRLFPFRDALDQLHTQFHQVIATGALPRRFR